MPRLVKDALGKGIACGIQRVATEARPGCPSSALSLGRLLRGPANDNDLVIIQLGFNEGSLISLPLTRWSHSRVRLAGSWAVTPPERSRHK